MEDTAFVDVYPVYFVKTGTSSQRGQAEAIEQEYNSIVTQLSDASGDRPRFDAATLPLRPTPAQLPALAAERFATWLIDVVVDLAPDHIVTLGEEVWETLGRAGLIRSAGAESLSRTRDQGYGSRGELEIGGTVIDWTPLAHPGAVRQSNMAPHSWGSVHGEWLGANSGG